MTIGMQKICLFIETNPVCKNNGANYPVGSVATLSEAEDQVELAASLIPTSAEPAELDAVCAALETHPEVLDATWSVSTTL